MGEIGGWREGEQDAGEIDAHSCTMGGSDVCAVRKVGDRGARLEVCGPGKRVEGLCGGQEEESLVLFGGGRGV